MGNTRRRPKTSKERSVDERKRRMLTPLPLFALIVVLAATVWLSAQRHQELELIQQQLDDQAQQEFLSEVDNSAQHVQSEIDRLTELLMGIRAFATSADGNDVSAIAEYLTLSGTAERFSDLRAVVVASSEPTATGPASVAAGANELMVHDASVAYPELFDIAGERESIDPFVIAGTWDDEAVVVIVFPLTDQFLSGRNLGWVALLIPDGEFASRALNANGTVRTTLTSTGLASNGTTNSTSDATITSDPSGRLETLHSIDVFGTAFVLRAATSPGFVQITSNSQVFIMIAAGIVTALGLYVALRSLVEARARAIETARTATAANTALSRRFRTSFESSPIGMAEIDALGRLVEANEAMCGQIGATRDMIIGRSLTSLVHESDRSAHVQRIEVLLNGHEEASQGEHRFQQPDGKVVWVSESISVIESDARGPRGMLVQSQDITAQRRAAWELAQQALHDDLTGLPNRALLMNRLKHALVRRQRTESQLAVMFIDIDRFKVINDSLGHEMGDEFLIQIADRIGTALRTGDTVARFGGDEFVVLCEEVSGESEALAVAQRIQASFAAPFQLGTTATYGSSSIGITLNSPAGDTADSLLRDADAAMYRAKETGKNRTELFDQTMRSTVVARMEIESQLRDALQNGEIVMHYQAIVDPQTYEPAGYEALIRWNHPEKGLLGPGAFLGVAEEAGLIHLVDSFALRQTCQQIADWIDIYPAARDVYVATNWSARHLGRFVQQVEQVLAETGIDPCHLVIEVTEGFLLEDSDASLVALEQLKALGVRIAIDDFGTGYSSLAYLTHFKVDFLKIDQSFVSKLPEDKASAAVIGAIADMAGRLGIALVAEGVETDEQIEMLASLGAPRLQGYRFAKPRPAADIAFQLDRRSRLASVASLAPATPL